jgi:hypothetical protein
MSRASENSKLLKGFSGMQKRSEGEKETREAPGRYEERTGEGCGRIRKTEAREGRGKDGRRTREDTGKREERGRNEGGTREGRGKDRGRTREDKERERPGKDEEGRGNILIILFF